MKFTPDILLKIEQMGSLGKMPDMIALELNMTQTQLDDERAKNKQLNEALNRAEENAGRFAISKLWADCLSGKNTTITKELFLNLLQKHNKNSDNKITFTLRSKGAMI